MMKLRLVLMFWGAFLAVGAGAQDAGKLPPLPLPEPASMAKPTIPSHRAAGTPQAASSTAPAMTTATPSVAAQPSALPSNMSGMSGMDAIERIRKNQGAEKIYTYRDKNGVVHVTNTPPPNIIENDDPQLITITGQKTQTVKSYSDRVKELEDQRTKEKEEKNKANDAKMADAQKKLQCEQIKSRMQLYQSDRKIATVGADGKDNIVSNEQRKATLETLKSSYDTLCGQ